jgi:hypothetical protein
VCFCVRRWLIPRRPQTPVFSQDKKGQKPAIYKESYNFMDVPKTSLRPLSFLYVSVRRRVSAVKYYFLSADLPPVFANLPVAGRPASLRYAAASQPGRR